MRAYCDDRAAALSLAATLQRENDLLRAENQHLRELVDPTASRWRGAVAHFSGAVAATLLLLGAMLGAGVIVQQTSAEAEATVTQADLGSRLASVSPREVVAAPTVAPASPVEAPPAPIVVVAPSPRAHHHRHRRHHYRHHSRG